VRRLLSGIKELLVFLLDGALLLGAVFVATGLRYDFASLGFQEDLTLRALIFTLLVQIGLYFGSFYDFRVRPGLVSLTRKVLVAFLFASVVLWALYYLFPQIQIGRGIFGIALGLAAPALLVWRTLLQRVIGARLFRTKVLLLGNGPLASECATVTRSLSSSGLNLVGMLAPRLPGPEEAPTPAPVLGGYDELLDVVQREGVDTVVVAPAERRGSLPMTGLLECRFAGVEVIDGLSYYERLTQKVYVRDLSPSWLIFSKGFNLSPPILAAKRALDVVLSLLGLTVLLPLLLLCGLLVKLSSPGPIFYTQTRVGKNGKPFTIIKLRSMTAPGPQGDDGRASSARDPETWNPETTRITMIGSWLRRLHLDELPQLINVVRGDMSLVGPRPERPEYIARLEQVIPFYRERHIVRPGVTGLAQVMYDYGASIQGSTEKLQYDLSYIRNLSLSGDLIILIRTVQMLLLGREERP
jgi:sugar transferase (PEP-CTERM system associated)